MFRTVGNRLIGLRENIFKLVPSENISTTMLLNERDAGQKRSRQKNKNKKKIIIKQINELIEKKLLNSNGNHRDLKAGFHLNKVGSRPYFCIDRSTDLNNFVSVKTCLNFFGAPYDREGVGEGGAIC